MPFSADRRERLLLWIPPALMLAVAGLQIILVHTIELSPWRGGGFGMFSVVDHSANRVLAAECLDATGNPCLIDLNFSGPDQRDTPAAQYARRLRARPHSRFGEQLADLLIAAEFVPVELPPAAKDMEKGRQGRMASLMAAEKPPLLRIAPTARTAAAPTPGAEPRATRLKALRLRVWRVQFEASTMHVTSEPVGDAIERGDWP